MDVLLYCIIGLIIGLVLGWFLSKFRLESQWNKQRWFSEQDIQDKYILKELFDIAQKRIERLNQTLESTQNDYLLVSKALSSKEQYVANLMEKLQSQQIEMDKMQERFKLEFENIANRLLEEKSQTFIRQNQTNLDQILSPLKEKLKDFEDKVEKTYWKNTEERISLKEEIKHLRDLNMQLSQDANQLVSALKGDNKMQGDWGEYQLEVLLEKAGLQKGVHFKTQVNLKDNKGQNKRPDFIINLPDNKRLIIDSKVSLKAYNKYHNTNDKNAQQQFLKEHIQSLRSHIRDLSSKNYQRLYQIHTPDYVLMFVPIEPAFTVAMQQNTNLFMEALDRNVVMVTTSTLLATMRTVSYIWKQEKQKRNVLEIAKQSGLLYDKFVNFINDLKEIGKKMEDAQTAYHGAMNKLYDSKKFGDTLVGRAERIRELGANASKKLPKDLL